MKILMVLDEEFPPDVRVEKEMQALRKAGHTVHLLCYTRRNEPLLETIDGAVVIRVPISPIQYKFKALALVFPYYFSFWHRHLDAQLAKEKYDALHFHDLTLAKVALEAGRRQGIPVIGDYHENRPEIMQHYQHVRSFPGNVLISVDAWRRFQQKYTPQLDHLVLVTREAKEYYASHYGIDRDRITVVENYPDVEALLHAGQDAAIPEKFTGRKVLLYFGDTGLRRGTGTILDAAAILKDDSRYAFVIIGDSREQGLLRQMKEARHLDNVELTGYLPLAEAIPWFRAAHAGLSPLLRNIHHDTTYANKLFQYMAFGLPAIVSDCKAQADVVREARCGLVHAAGSADDLVQQIKNLEDRDMHATLGRNGAEAVKNNHNFTAAGDRLVKLYEKVRHENQ